MATTSEQDTALLRRLKKDDSVAFRALFDSYYKYLVVTAYNVLGDSEMARDLAQDVLAELWNKRQGLEIQSSLKAYLRRAVVNKTLNYIKARRLDFSEPEKSATPPLEAARADQQLEKEDLQRLIQTAIEALPERCRMVFTLCRLEGLSHKEIAAQLDISTKTVENQMTKSLKLLRGALQPYFNQMMLWIVWMGIMPP